MSWMKETEDRANAHKKEQEEKKAKEKMKLEMEKKEADIAMNVIYDQLIGVVGAGLIAKGYHLSKKDDGLDPSGRYISIPKEEVSNYFIVEEKYKGAFLAYGRGYRYHNSNFSKPHTITVTVLPLAGKERVKVNPETGEEYRQDVYQKNLRAVRVQVPKALETNQDYFFPKTFFTLDLVSYEDAQAKVPELQAIMSNIIFRYLTRE